VLDGFVSRSFTEGADGDGTVYDAALNFTADLYGGYLEHMAISRDAVAGSGFITRTDIRKSSINLRRRIRPAFAGLRLNDFRFNGDYQSTMAGRFQDWSAGLSSMPTWNAGDNGTISWTAGETQVDYDFVLADSVPVPAGRYRTNEWRFSYSSSSSRPWIVSAGHSRSAFYGGRLRTWSASLAWTPAPAISVTPSFSRNDVVLPNGSFTADILGFRAIWALSTKMTTNALVQYNRLTDDFVSNIRFNFIHRPGSDLYVVFTEQRGVEDDAWALADRGMVVKFTYLFRF